NEVLDLVDHPAHRRRVLELDALLQAPQPEPAQGRALSLGPGDLAPDPADRDAALRHLTRSFRAGHGARADRAARAGPASSRARRRRVPRGRLALAASPSPPSPRPGRPRGVALRARRRGDAGWGGGGRGSRGAGSGPPPWGRPLRVWGPPPRGEHSLAPWFLV